MRPDTPVISIQGPTASGKSALAEKLAAHFHGEIISADSMQIYRGMDIGTAKQPVEQRGVTYHGIDLCEPGESFSAALFQEYARAIIDSLLADGVMPVICGGTWLYVSAVIDEMEFAQGEQKGNEIRQRFEQYAQEHGPEGLYELLVKIDPQSAECVHPNNVRRVIRALEMHERGESYAARKDHFKKIEPHYPCVRFAVNCDREVLYSRINARVDNMVESGLVQEVRDLLDRGFRESLTASQAIGYKEIVDYLDGNLTLEQAADSIKQSTRRYAKRQLSWLRSKSDLVWLDATRGITDELVAKACDIVVRAREEGIS